MTFQYIKLQNHAYNYLINCCYQEGERCYKELIELNPKQHINYYYLGLILFLQDRDEEAEELWLELILESSLNDNDKVIQELTNLMAKIGNYYYQKGYLKPATKIYTYLLQQNPSSLEYKLSLANLFSSQGKLDEGIFLYQEIIKVSPIDIKAHFYLGQSFLQKDLYLIAYQHFYLCTLLTKDNLLAKKYLAIALNSISFNKIDLGLLKIIESCFQHPDIRHQNLATPCLSILKINSFFANLLKLAEYEDYQQLEVEYKKNEFKNLCVNNIFNELLRKTLLSSLNLENFITNVRHYFLRNVNTVDILNLKLIVSLGVQAFNTEYIYNIAELEREQLNNLKQDLEILLNHDNSLVFNNLQQIKLAIFCMYFPLSALPEYKKILNIEKEKINQDLLLLIEIQIKNYQEEEEIKKTIPSLTKIEDDTSIKVKSQYEENPFPRWLGITLLPPIPLSREFGALFPYFNLPENFINRKLNILIAGCGTGQHAVSVSTTYEDVDILAVDLSRSSLAYGIRMSKKLGINNIDFQQADILDLSKSLNQKFDLIESSGVIHHLKNPLAGLQVLVELLAPSGLLKLGLYSHNARQSIVKAREYIKERGFSSSVEDLRAFRQEVITKRENLQWVNDLMGFGDFYTTSQFRDLVFHVQEHQFTIPQIKEIIESFKLKFIGFQLDQDHKNKYKEMFKDDLQMNNLSNWHKFEEIYPSTFKGMYQFWCQKL